MDEVGTQRDELLLRITLAKAEAKEKREQLESKWQNPQDHLPEVRNATSESADNIGAALGLVGEELGKAFKRLRDTLD